METAALNLARTSAALAAYDSVDGEVTTYLDGHVTGEGVLRIFKELELAGEAVGVAFGEDTSDRNSMETCRGCVRPAVPSPGMGLSFVRRMVAEWRSANPSS